MASPKSAPSSTPKRRHVAHSSKSSSRRTSPSAKRKRPFHKSAAAPNLKIGEIEPPTSAHTNANVDALRRQIESSAASRFRDKWGFDVHSGEPASDSTWQWQSSPHIG